MPADAPTMRDVARHAGVSVQTVSCVVNETGHISPETRTRVLRSIDTLRYRRNPIARSMRTRKTRLIALLVMDITNPVLSVIASTIEAAAYDQDYGVLLYNTGLDSAREQAYIHDLGDRHADGVILVNAIERNHVKPLLEHGIPTVLIDCPTPDSPVPTVSVNNDAGAYLATRHLIDLGHKRIAHIAGSRRLEIARQRETAYFRALDDVGLSYRNSVSTKQIHWGYQAGYAAMRQLLAEAPRPTAVFAASDELAIGAYRALAEAGLSAPEDLSVVGFDNIEAAAYVTPGLTTVHQPFEELGHLGFSLLLRRMDDHDAEAHDVLLPPQLVLRHSTQEAR